MKLLYIIVVPPFIDNTPSYCRRASFLDTKSLAGQIRAACEAKDAVYIKNQTVTLDAKLAKFVGRAGERSKVSTGGLLLVRIRDDLASFVVFISCDLPVRESREHAK